MFYEYEVVFNTFIKLTVGIEFIFILLNNVPILGFKMNKDWEVKELFDILGK